MRKKLRNELPETKVLMLAVFPRGEKPNEFRDTVLEGSRQASRIADNKNVFYLDIGEHFVETDGTISKDVMPDGLHLTEKGYRIWAERMEPTPG